MVQTAPDDQALLRLSQGSGDVAGFVTETAEGVVEIDIGQVDNGQTTPGEGVNSGSVTALLNLLLIENQGSKTVDVSASQSGGVALVSSYTDPNDYVELDETLDPSGSVEVGLVINAGYADTTVTETVSDGEEITLVITAESVE